MAEYELFIIKDMSELKEGEEIVLNVRDTKNIEMKTVKAIISSKPGELPGGETLWLRWQRGKKQSEPWAIKIIEVLSSLGESVAKDYY